MDYIELTLDAADAEQAKILTAELADFPFESFEQEGARLKAYIPQERLADCKGEVDALLARYGKRACLEAELPETELAARRIGFYERHGFTVNADYAYFQPALAPGGSPLPMHLLTTGGACTACELRAMETLVHTRVYGQAPAMT